MKKVKKSKKLSASALQSALHQYLLAHPKKQFSARQLAGLLKIDNNKDSVEHALRQLEQSGAVTESKQGAFMLTHSGKTYVPETEIEMTPQEEKPKNRRSTSKAASNTRKSVEGVVDMTRSGAAYVVNELLASDVYIPQRYMNGALHGDTVRISIFPERPRRRNEAPRKPEGEITQILKRATEFFIGTLRKSRKYAILMPDNPNMPTDIMVPLDLCGTARDGDKVVVRVTDWQEGRRSVPTGKVTQVLGMEGGNDFEMKKILINAGFELNHSEEAMAEAEAIPETISPQEIALRRDFRDILTFTIDPEDAKDFDDALSYRLLDNGNVEIGVHIADVTHYLKPDSPIDREAYKRSTSVYLVDRCLPMLPEKLSNNLCSLVPHQDRLTFSAVFEFDGKDKIVKRWFGKTVIHSAKRFTYEEAQTVLDQQPAPTVAELPIFPALREAILVMQRLSRAMRKEREKNNALSFESDEVRFRLDAHGVPVEVYVKERKEAHLLIEDFMLLANKEVAFFIDQIGKDRQEVPFVYRVHDEPDMERVAEFARFAAEMGHPMKTDTPRQIARSFNDLTKAAQKDDRLKLLAPLAIRTMAKAVYTTENIGHYGLGFTHYSHFTSPIRRYSDVLAHRILYANLEGRAMRYDRSKLEEKCKNISNQERKAADAERESVKFKQAEYISKHIGEVFHGTVSGMIDKGFFVQLDDSYAEGLVDFRMLDDLYVIDDSKMRARGRKYGHVIKMGDRVEVKVIAADIQRRQIELEWVNE